MRRDGFGLAALSASVIAATWLAGGGARAGLLAAPAAGADDAVQRGHYLVTAIGCNDCHTPLKPDAKLGFAPDMSRMLSGHPEGGPSAPRAPDPRSGEGAIIGADFTSFRLPAGTVYASNLTPDRETGLGTWTEELFVKALRSGTHLGAGQRPILPPMPWPGYAQLTDADLHAVWSYLRTIPAVHNAVPEPTVPKEALDGMLRANELVAGSLRGGAPMGRRPEPRRP